MLIDNENKQIYCFYCNKWYDLHKIFLHVLHEGSITCPYDHILGYEWDTEWKKFYEYE